MGRVTQQGRHTGAVCGRLGNPMSERGESARSAEAVRGDNGAARAAITPDEDEDS